MADRIKCTTKQAPLPGHPSASLPPSCWLVCGTVWPNLFRESALSEHEGRMTPAWYHLHSWRRGEMLTSRGERGYEAQEEWGDCCRQEQQPRKKETLPWGLWENYQRRKKNDKQSDKQSKNITWHDSFHNLAAKLAYGVLCKEEDRHSYILTRTNWQGERGRHTLERWHRTVGGEERRLLRCLHPVLTPCKERRNWA